MFDGATESLRFVSVSILILTLIVAQLVFFLAGSGEPRKKPVQGDNKKIKLANLSDFYVQSFLTVIFNGATESFCFVSVSILVLILMPCFWLAPQKNVQGDHKKIKMAKPFKGPGAKNDTTESPGCFNQILTFVSRKWSPVATF